jgi:hypothetical protein
MEQRMSDSFATEYIINIAAQVQEAVPAAIQSLQTYSAVSAPTASINILFQRLKKLQQKANSLNKIKGETIPIETVVAFYNALVDTCRKGTPYLSNNIALQELERIKAELLSQLGRLVPIEKPDSLGSATISPSAEYRLVKSGVDAIAAELELTKEKIDLQEFNIDEISDFTKKQISQIKSEISNISETAKGAMTELEEYINEKKENLQIIDKELNNQLGLLSGKMLAGGYAQQAEEERKSANSMRNASVLCLVTILVVVIYSLIELSGGEITVERSLVKLALLLFLLAPAAYLARESTKHRNEHYAIKQTALDLNAIGPFIASLDKDGQDLIKAKIAERLFCSTKDKPESNTFPINAHEVIIKLIEKFESSTKPATDKTATKLQNE